MGQAPVNLHDLALVAYATAPVRQTLDSLHVQAVVLLRLLWCKCRVELCIGDASNEPDTTGRDAIGRRTRSWLAVGWIGEFTGLAAVTRQRVQFWLFSAIPALCAIVSLETHAGGERAWIPTRPPVRDDLVLMRILALGESASRHLALLRKPWDLAESSRDPHPRRRLCLLKYTCLTATKLVFPPPARTQNAACV